MADPAYAAITDRSGYVHPNVEALLASMAESSRVGAQAVLQQTGEADAWPFLERSVTRCIAAQQASSAGDRLDAQILDIIRQTQAQLRLGPMEAHRATDYAAGIDLIDDARNAGRDMVAPGVLAGHVRAAVAWFSVWHLLAAEVPRGTILAIIDGPRDQAPAPTQRPLPPPERPRPRPALKPEPEPEQANAQASALAETPTPLDRMRQWATKILTDTRAYLALVAQTVRGVAAATAKARAERLAAEALEQRPDQVELTKPETASTSDRPSARLGPTTAGHRLDGMRMRGWVLGTWLMLIILSWVALFWGALLSAIVTGPFVATLLMTTGLFAVPLWASFWGFLGLGFASMDTLRQMGFRDAKADGWLATTTARMARQLDLPPPTVGTVPVFNAFAMGTDHRNATVAIGKPLMEKLSRDEVAAVIGHELGHVVSGDMRRMMLMRTFQNACVWYMFTQGAKQFARWAISWAAEIAILAFSRRREYWADAVGAALTSTDAMIGALRKLDKAPALSHAEQSHARFMLRGTFSTHPTTAERIAALEAGTYVKRLPVKG